MNKQLSLFEGARMTLEDSISLSLASLQAYGEKYKHWACAYSGGKDSSATVTLVAWAIKNHLVPTPETFTVLYADTRMELPPLQQTAVKLMGILRSEGFETRIVEPDLDHRFFVYMFGRGVPPSRPHFRWCTGILKINPMMSALSEIRQRAGEKFLMITGVRLGESAARDQRIALSCSRDSGECGQGWYQKETPGAYADTLAPLLHWRVCHVFDWLYFDERHGYDVDGIAAIYGEEEIRTGCIACPVASRDTSLERMIKLPEWAHVRPLLELRPLYEELSMAKHRKRKASLEMQADGQYSKKTQRLGPLTMPARAYGLDRVLDIQQRASVDLINPAEEARIRELWALNTWPEKWSAEDVDATVPIDSITLDELGRPIVQALLVK